MHNAWRRSRLTVIDEAESKNRLACQRQYMEGRNESWDLFDGNIARKKMLIDSSIDGFVLVVPLRILTKFGYGR